MTRRVEALKVAVKNRKIEVSRPIQRQEFIHIIETLCEEGYLQDWSRKEGNRLCNLRSHGGDTRVPMRSRKIAKRITKPSQSYYRTYKERLGVHGNTEQGERVLSTSYGVHNSKAGRKYRTGGKVRRIVA